MGIVQEEISAKHFLHAIIDFGYNSGLTLNMTKTEAVWLGVNRNQTDKPLNIRWPALPIKVLDIYFGYDGELCEKRNFGDKIDKAKQIINMWKQKDLSLIGRVQIIKTFRHPDIILSYLTFFFKSAFMSDLKLLGAYASCIKFLNFTCGYK